MSAKEQAGPQRSCISCRQSADKKELVRYVLTPDKTVLIDYRQRLPGRGVYTCFNPDCLERVIKRQGFKRGFKTECRAEAAELKQQLRRAVEERITNLVGMARKAGIITSGTGAVLDQLKREPFPALIILTEDISVALADKICRTAEYKNVYCVRMFDKARLGRLLGREERSAAAFDHSALAGTLMFELERFEQLLREN